jgi:hypothetical protein
MLIFCLVVAVVVQGLSAVTLISQRAVHDETAGRARLGEKESALAGVRQTLLEQWRPLAPTWSDTTDHAEAVATESLAEEIPGSQGWLMRATVRQDPSLSRMMVSATLERGQDGLDLPLAAVVAHAVTASPEREWPAVDIESNRDAANGGSEQTTAEAPCYLRDHPVEGLLGSACVLTSLRADWHLDRGWSEVVPHTQNSKPTTVAAGDHTILLEGRSGTVVELPSIRDAGGPDTPLLMVIVGGADLDVQGRGDLHGVIVADRGSVLLDGTVLHGAVFATEEVDLGETGRVLFNRHALRWATDGSLDRVRLVPGTRREKIE